MMRTQECGSSKYLFFFVCLLLLLLVDYVVLRKKILWFGHGFELKVVSRGVLKEHLRQE